MIAASGTLAQIIPPSLVLIVLADQLGKSVGDLYKGAFIPGFVLTGLYVGYIVLISFIKPQWVPALPPEARTIKEDDGTSGLRSLTILTGVSLAIAIAFAKFLPDTTPLDETIVVSMCVGVGVAFFAAIINKVTKMGLLSNMAERVTLCSFLRWHSFSWCLVPFSWALQPPQKAVLWGRRCLGHGHGPQSH